MGLLIRGEHADLDRIRERVVEIAETDADVVGGRGLALPEGRAAVAAELPELARRRLERLDAVRAAQNF